MVSTKPYFVRAIFEWCVDQGFTPYLTVAVDGSTRVPREFVRNGQIVLNVGADATHQLLMGNEEITFQARFNGVAFPVVVPMDAVLAIYAKENGQGMAFEVAERPGADDGAAVESSSAEAELPAASVPEATSPPAPGRPHLTRIK
jgi:stringent starvation protein B